MKNPERTTEIIASIPLAAGGVGLVVTGFIGEGMSISLGKQAISHYVQTETSLVQEDKAGHDDLFNQTLIDVARSAVGGGILSPVIAIAGLLMVRKAASFWR